MDILAAIAPVSPTAPTDTPTPAGEGEATAFASALQQAQAGDTETPAVPTVASTPFIETTAAASESPAPMANAAPLPELPATSLPPLPAEPAVVTQAAAPTPDDVEQDLPPLDTEPLAVTEDDPVDDAAQDDAATQPSQDPLHAIRQRLDLIDNAGQLAYAALVVPTPTPPLQAAPVARDTPADASPSGSLADAVRSTPMAPDSLDVEPAPLAPTPETVVTVAEGMARDSDQPRLDVPRTPAATTTSEALPGLSALAPASTTVATASTTTSETLSLPPAVLGSDAWQDDLGQQVISMVRRGERQANLQLNPTDLGPLSISLNLGEAGVQAQFQSGHASVRAAVEQALPQLQAALAAQGLSLGQASVNDGASRQASEEQPRRESPGGGSRQSQAAQTTEVVHTQPLAVTGMGVDLYL